MKYLVKFTSKAEKQLAGLPVSLQKQITLKINDLELDPRPPGCVKLEGGDDLYRIRVGDHRIVYAIRDAILYILVVRIGHRREVYRHS
jgi:mRNA interferase RelE/StbE